MNMDRMSNEAMDARVWLIIEAMVAQDSSDEATEDLAMLLLGPTDAEMPEGDE